MMVSPESYIAQFEDAPYSELIRARAELVAELAELENHFECGSQECPSIAVSPSEDTRYKTGLEYLAVLIDLMIERAPELTGEEFAAYEDDDEEKGD